MEKPFQLKQHITFYIVQTYKTEATIMYSMLNCVLNYFVIT